MLNYFRAINNYLRKHWMSISWEFRRYDLSDWFALFGVLLIIVLVLAFWVSLFLFVILWPLAVAWAINYLFATSLPMTFKTWAAIWVIFFIVDRLRGRPFITVRMRK